MQRLAISDFENKSGVGGALGAQLTNYLTNQSRQIITAAGKFTIVHPTDPNADGVFTGQINSIVVNQTQSQPVTKTRSDGTTYTEITYTREVSLAFEYNIISSTTKMPVGNSVTKSGTQKDSQTDSSRVTDALVLAQKIVDAQLKTLQQDIVPTIVSTNRALMKETSKDKTVQQRMKEAETLVKNNNYEEAIRQYDAISSEYGSVAARTNADILREAVGSDIAARTELTELFNDKDGRAEKATKGAIDALYSKLPSGTNIMIMKTSSTEGSMLNYVVDQMTKTIIQEGKLKVVDRSNQALVNAEVEHQLSGNVSDDSIISIGHQLGVQYIVQCWISGEMSMRRLNIKMLSVETAQVTAQNDFEI
jgi:hypothetical protein